MSENRNFHTCTHCSHPLYAAIRCSSCGRWSDEKERTESALQRLSDFHQEIESNTAEIRRYHKACEMALEALNSDGTGSFPYRRDAAIDALREVLGEKK